MSCRVWWYKVSGWCLSLHNRLVRLIGGHSLSGESDKFRNDRKEKEEGSRGREKIRGGREGDTRRVTRGRKEVGGGRVQIRYL